MKITLAGVPGSGKSTLRQALAQRYQLAIKGTGDFMRAFALQHGYRDITQFLVEYVSQHSEVDRQVDEEQRQFGLHHDNFVLDAHLGFYVVPDSFKLFLTCDPEVAAQRILLAGRSSEAAVSFDEALASFKTRIHTMQSNFQRLYGVDIYDPQHYDCCIDTTHRTPEEAFELVEEHLDIKYAL